MAKKKTPAFICQSCGQTHTRWAGRCDQCGEWNTLVESLETASGSGKALRPQQLADVKKSASGKRIKSGISDIDDVLGGGMVAGSVILLAGEPGMGKSTLALQIARQVSQEQSVLYVSGEESLQQVKMRAERMFGKASSLEVISSTNTDNIVATVAAGDYDLVVVDSIQTLSVNEVTAAAGSVSQITNSTHLLTRLAKEHDVAMLMIGHVTKQGSIAGPKILEHIVDVVLNFEGDRYGGFKMLRAAKNRFGSTSEVAVLEMHDTGLQAVDNPSASLLQERQVSDGSVVLATMEGNRPILVEVQALVTTSHFGYPKRTASGFDLNRLNLLVAVLSRRTKLQLSDKDIYINIVGGIKINEPAADLAVCMSIASASKGMQLKDDAVVFGEVGLSGEIRRVRSADKRVEESRKLGFAYAIGPQSNKAGDYLKPVKTVKQTLNTYLQKE